MEFQISKQVRREVADSVGRWFLSLSLPAVAISLARFFEVGWLPPMGAHVALLAVLAAIVGLGDRLSYQIKASALVLLMFLVGVAGHVSLGSPFGISFFVAAPIMAGVFFGERAGLICIGIGCIAIAAIYSLFALGVLPRISLDEYVRTPTAWATNTAAAMVSAVGPLIALSRYRRALARQAQAAEAGSAAKSRFLAIMSHELRTPLAGMIGMADILLEEVFASEQRKVLVRLRKNGNLLLELLNEVLDFSKIEAGKLQLEKVPFRVSDILSDLQELYLPLALEKGLAFAVSGDDLDVPVVGDPKHLRQVLGNLTSNAIKFTENGGVRINALQLPAASSSTALFKFAIEDTGIGISAEQEALLLQPFVQADASTARKFGGTGLGLAIAQSIIRAMGGNISLRSELGKGSTFTVEIKLERSGVALDPEDSSEQQSETTFSGGPYDLLLAEDVDALRLTISAMLIRRGHRVTSVSNGWEAVNAAKARAFDIILMDVHMPVMDGMKAIENIRSEQRGGLRTPIIVLTADIMSASITQYLAGGADAVVPKPVNWALLEREMSRLVDGRPAPAPAPDIQGAPSHLADDLLDYNLLAEHEQDLGMAYFAKMLPAFSTSTSAFVDEIRASHVQTNKEGVRKAAHALKGLSLQFGAARLAKEASKIEAHPDSLTTRMLQDIHMVRLQTLREMCTRYSIALEL